MTTPARFPSEQPPVAAAGYVRVSMKRQAEGYSPDVQKTAIRDYCREHGFSLLFIAEDHESGLNAGRVQYQRLIEAARHGEIDCVVVHAFDRFSRRSAEFMKTADELEQLGVGLYSVTEGKDVGGLTRAVHTGFGEQFARNISIKVVPSRESAARAGRHMGVTPYGYKRVYPEHTGSFRRQPGVLQIDETEAAVVREIYRRYTAGGESCASLAEWLNATGAPPPTGARSIPDGPRVWWGPAVNRILHNPVYIGKVSYNKRHAGKFGPRKKGDAFVAQGTHEPLIDVETWTIAAARLQAAARKSSYNWTARKAVLGTGLFVCAGCGGAMIANRLTGRENRRPYYACYRGASGNGCREHGYGLQLAHEALLAELSRLQGTPWTPQKERRLLGGETGSRQTQIATLKKRLAAERALLERNVLLMHGSGDDEPSDEEVRALRSLNKQISGRIKALADELATMGEQELRLPDLRLMHSRVHQTDLALLVERLRAGGDEDGLRELVLAFVAHARLIERRPATRSTWGRMEVTWAPDVQALLQAGLLTLGPPAPAPLEPPRLTRIYKGRRVKHT